MNFCDWFTNDCLSRLLEGQRSRSGVVSLHSLEIYDTRVTPAGLRQALGQAPDTLGMQGSIFIGLSREDLLDEDLDPDLSDSYVSQESLEEWRALARDFSRVNFPTDYLKYRLSMLED